MSQTNGRPGKPPAALPALPTPQELADRVLALRSRMLSRITEERIDKIMDAQLEAAENGSLKACQFIVGVLGTGGGPSTVVNVQQSANAVAVAVPSVGVLRKMAGFFLMQHAPASPRSIAAQLEVDDDTIAEVLDSPLFRDEGSKGYSLSAEGQKEFS